MCGLAGYLGRQAQYGHSALNVLRLMTETIVHRGPDADGHWSDTEAGIALGHRRLAVVDLSPAGAQPMKAASGRYVIAFNGEIYNHLTLRAELEQECTPRWRGHSDTETLLAGFDAWGIEATVKKCIGMFAIAVWDRETQTLTLVRDRLGEKPLYYGWQGTGEAATFLFGSELKALRAHPSFKAPISRDALALYMRHMAVSGTHCIYEGLHKLEPGALLTVSLGAPQPRVQVYWSGLEVAARGVAEPYEGTPTEAVNSLELLLKDAVRQQMMADVPLGAFLSGGVDSSTVVSLMQLQSSQRVKTFSIGFHEQGYNEAEHAKAVAQHLGTDHTELYVTPQQAMQVVPQLPSLYDEPFADSSQIPTYLVSQLARKHVTVSLSGDGGDELFCGYTRYTGAEALWSKLNALPSAVRHAGAGLLKAMPAGGLNQLGTMVSSRPRWSRLGDRLHKGADLMGCRSLEDLYRGMVSNWKDPAVVVLGAREPVTLLKGRRPELARLSGLERLMALDLLTYLPDDILTKVDRAAMGVSLETRVPLLDHRAVEFAWRLPLKYKLCREPGGLSAKWALRQVLYRHVPRSLIERPKMGFGLPIDVWLRGPLRGWAEDLLSEALLKRQGFLNPAPIRQKWAEHQSGRRNWQHALWCVLMFQAWLGEQERA